MLHFFSDSPQVAQVYVHGTRIPHPHYSDARFYETVRAVIPISAEPPPAHRNQLNPNPTNFVPNELPAHIHSKALEREREREQREKERISSIPGMIFIGT